MGSELHVPTLGFVFALILIGDTIWDLDQLSSLRYGLAAAVAGAAAPAARGRVGRDRRYRGRGGIGRRAAA